MGKVIRVTMAIIGVMVLSGLAPSPVAAAAPDWVEPRALNIVDIAGQVPDSVLDGNILVYNSGGIMMFVSSRNEGDALIIRTRMYPRHYGDGSGPWVTSIPLLGQGPILDHPGSVSPESWLRLYSNGRDVTSVLVGAWGSYSEPCLCSPEVNAGSAERYPSRVRTLSGLAVEAQGVHIPANMGGVCNFYGDYAVLDAEFTFEAQQLRPAVTYVAEQQDIFQSYIGPGGVGVFQPLMEQMQRRYGWRHDRIAIYPPAEANYVLFTYPAMPFDPNDGTLNNLGRPVAGTVRLALDNGMLSQDLVAGGAFPLRAVWQDADQSAGPFLSLMPPVDRLTPPEYVLPAGIDYDPCYLAGNCGDSTLNAIYNATMTIRTIYLKVEAPTEGVAFVPLGVADETWSGQRLSGSRSTASESPLAYLPLLVLQRPTPTLMPTLTPMPTATPTPEPTPNYPSARPAGLFEPTTGRMLGYLW